MLCKAGRLSLAACATDYMSVERKGNYLQGPEAQGVFRLVLRVQLAAGGVLWGSGLVSPRCTFGPSSWQTAGSPKQLGCQLHDFRFPVKQSEGEQMSASLAQALVTTACAWQTNCLTQTVSYIASG